MAIAVRAGELRHSLIIEAKTTSKNDYGEKSDTWSTVATVRAGIRPLYGREYVESRAIKSEVTHKIIMRYYSGLTTKHRLKFGARYFDIETIMNLEERNQLFEILAVEYAI